MKVIDNFLPDDQFEDISKEILGKFFPWYWQENSHGYQLENGTWVNIDNVPQLTHCFTDDGKIFSNYFDTFKKSSLFYKLNIKDLAKFKVNCNYKTSEQKIGFFHTDYRGEDIIKDITTSVFYLNSNNGGTKFEDGTFVKSVRNRMVTFDCSTKHAAVSCTDEHRRIVVNINYYLKNWQKINGVI
tara:strand:- start:5 stop:559 length:555 start_codon:yes stop_codon:yes gene_type:complete